MLSGCIRLLNGHRRTFEAAASPAVVALQLYNVRTRQKEPFVPREEGKVGMYVCGLTVYDHAHLGHARAYVSFEIIRRWLERSYDVNYVQNVTDVEDKIINRAAELGVSPREHSAHWDQVAHDALRRAGVRDPNHFPHVTTHIGPIIAYIKTIIANGHAYATDAGNVYFDVPAYATHAESAHPMDGYGCLSRRDYKEMAAGVRKDVESDKQHPADFALWKTAAEGQHIDANWDSPWGRGRPGWHIECSVMATGILGHGFDIHGGGQDLIFPHHENEIAQAQAHSGSAPFVKTWMHAGFLNVDGVKMSKSLGNFIVLTELLDEMDAAGMDPAVLRFYFAQTQYRSKIDFSRKGLDECAVAVDRLERTRKRLHAASSTGSDLGMPHFVPQLEIDFIAAMNDDIHTPGALAALFAFQKEANVALEAGLNGESAHHALKAFEKFGNLLTLFDKPVATNEIPAKMAELIVKRAEARAAKDWGAADAIRDQIAAAGWIVVDSADGARLERA